MWKSRAVLTLYEVLYMSVEHSAVTVLQTLDDRLLPKVFLLGIPEQESVASRPVWSHSRTELAWESLLDTIREHPAYRQESKQPTSASSRSIGVFTEPEVFVEGNALQQAMLSLLKPLY